MRPIIFAGDVLDRARELIVALDGEAFPVKAAFWSPVGEAGEWRLFIASRMVDEEGPAASLRAHSIRYAQTEPFERKFHRGAGSHGHLRDRAEK